eukprot:TRINITY_DN5488_c0_g1_i3.p1 TRINITY_DN5488_c0_g1~~TRINITY_DN5488_c0_g1_i3.p1  ORF type:complete len:401 (+),score=64.07 TRINITY_DN5488_c0_g1_i3:140-1204(+)
MKLANEDNAILLFAKKLKRTLEKALKDIKNGLLPIQWNAQVDHKSQTLEQGNESFHLELSKGGKHQLYLIVGSGNDKGSALSKSMENQFKAKLPPQMSPAGKCNFSSFFGVSSICSNRNQSAYRRRNPLSTKHIFEKEIKLSQEATNVIKLAERLSNKSQTNGRIMCLISYVQMGARDAEAKMNIHYINTADRKILIKEKNLGKSAWYIPVRLNLFHSSTVSTLLQHIQSHFKGPSIQSSIHNLSQHQLAFIMHNARNTHTEDVIAEAVLKWCKMNIDKVALESLADLVGKVMWRNVSAEKLGEVRSGMVDERIVKMLPEVFIVPPLFSPPARSEDSRTNGSSSANTIPLRMLY